MTRCKAVLALENGMLFEGIAVGALGSAVGEVVFNTAITGYQEILTDPSYAKQIITLTHPHIGNTGVNQEDEESRGIWATGLIIRDLPHFHQGQVGSWRQEQPLDDYLKAHKVVAIAELDTRKLTRILRDEGAQKGYMLAADTITPADIAAAVQAAKDFPGIQGMDLAQEVTVATAYPWREGTWQPGQGYQQRDSFKYQVVAYDLGVKRNILRLLVDRGCELTVVPAKTPADEVLALQPDGVFLSNGPGDPAPCDYMINAIRQILTTNTPLFGICLGMQLLGIAAGMKTKKMNHGHHGANHPVQNLEDGSVLITSQNHGFCIDDGMNDGINDVELPDRVAITHRSLFDHSIQGIHLKDRPAFGFQGHPEASPGPHDARPLFDHFIALMAAAQQSKA